MKRLLIAAATFATAVSAPVSAANLITNGGFEAGNTGFTTGYNYIAAPGPTALYVEGDYTVGGNSGAYHSSWANVGPQAGQFFFIGNGSTSNNVTAWEQTVNGLSLGTTYNFSAYIANVCCNANFGGPNGTPVIVAIRGLNIIASGPTSGTGNWTQLAGSFVATNTSTTISIYNDNSQASGSDFGLDSISLTAAVPEMSTWAMMIGGFGLVGVAMRRRRTSVRFANA